MRTAPPRPDEAPAQVREERRWLPALAVLAVIVAVTGGAQVVDVAISGTADPVVVGGIVTVTPEPGWEVVSTSEGSETSQALLTHGSASLLVVALSDRFAPAQELARGYAEALGDRFAQLTIGEPAAEGIERVRFGYVGITADGVAVEGVVTTVAGGASGDGVIFDGSASKGGLGAAVGDLRRMVDTAEVL